MNKSSQTRILVVDDSSVVRQQLRRLLERYPEWEVCGEAIDGREAIDKVADLKPDLVLLDFAMPVLNGLKSAQSILKMFPGTLIMLFTTFLSNQLLEEARQVGIHGALAKGDLVRDLAPGIQALLRHESFFPASVPG
jgi:DNA-binding NarL/FixJ family response regulator